MKFLKKGMPIAAGILAAGLFFVQPSNAKAAEDNNTIPENVSICGEDVSGMTVDEANEVVEDYLDQYEDVTFTLKAGSNSVEASAEDLSLMARNADVATRAVNYGKEGSLIARYKANKDLEEGNGKDFQISLTTDTTVTKKYLDDNSATLNTEAVNNSVERVDGEFQYVEGTEGVTVKLNKSATAIADYIAADWDGEDTSIDLVTQLVEPEGTKEELSKIQDLLGAYNTDFHTSSAGRAQNVKNGASKINGTVLYPGEEFSVYEAVSPFSAENGYELAGSYENGTTVETYGGGICQVSTTLYNAVMRSELEIVTRSCHSMIVSYVEPSMDAAIAGTSKDFQFKNNLKSPIYIEGYTSGGIIYFNIYGEETRDANREVSYVSEVTSQADPGVEFVASGDFPVGYIEKTQSAHTGYTAKLWKIVTVDGKEVSRDVYNNSTYKPSNMIYTVGVQSDNGNAIAAINAAIATNDEATVRAAASQWCADSLAVQAAQQAAAQQQAAQQSQDAAAIEGTVNTDAKPEGTITTPN